MYRYETHLHTFPVSRCAHVSPRDVVYFYKEAGYDGIFITNHFLDGNINIDSSLPYEEKIEFYFSDYEEALLIGNEIGLKVFFGVEMSYYGTDFLVYGLDKKWFLSHPGIEKMKKTEALKLIEEAGALIIQAHPFREANYIDHIRLFPRHVHGVEVFNGCRTEFENKMAELYANQYGLLHFAGSDNHIGKNQNVFGGMETSISINNVNDFIEQIKNRIMNPFINIIK